MRKTLRFLLAGGLLALTACLSLWADPPPLRTTGRVLLLDNDRVLEGDIQREGNQYRIRRDIGEVWIPAAKGQRLCADWKEAFEVLKLQANLFDADEHMRLARSCALHNLREQGLEELRLVLRSRPQHVEARHLLNVLQRSQTDVVQVPLPPLAAAPLRPAVDLNAESLAVFNTRVQPILMNACASCHATGRGGDFKLNRCYDGQLNRKATQENLAAVMNYLRPEQPEVSPLLIKAVSLHGNAGQTPLPGRASQPYKALQEWVQQVVTTNPSLRKDMAALAASRPTLHAGMEPQTATPSEAKMPALIAESAAPRRPVPETQQDSTAPADEFDPVLFNRQAHPERQK